MVKGKLGTPRPFSQKEVVVVVSGITQSRNKLESIAKSAVDSSYLEPSGTTSYIDEGSTFVVVQVKNKQIALTNLNMVKDQSESSITASDLSVNSVLEVVVE